MQTVAVIAVVSAAFSAFVAAGASIWMTVIYQKPLRVSQEQDRVSQKQLYDQRRPVLYPTDGLHGQFVDRHGNVAWMAQDPALMVRNTGAGVALNVAALLLAEQGRTMSERFTAWHPLPMPPDPTPQKVELQMGNSTFPDTDTIASHPLYAPAKPSPGEMLIGGATWYVLRLTLTYEDIFGRKHAAIFNYTSTGRWQTVAICEDIKEDLYTLQEAATTAALAHATATMPPTIP